MTIIPLDLERTFERRWAARFFSPEASARKWQPLAAPGKGKRRTRLESPRPDTLADSGKPQVSPGLAGIAGQ